MQYGKFVNDGRVYQVTTPKTPSTWTNYLFNDSYHVDVSQTLQGKSSRVDNYTRTTCTTDYRQFYIYDRVSKVIVNPNQSPLKGHYQKFSCNHGIEATELSSLSQEVQTSIRVFVPPQGTHEIWTITLTNESSLPKALTFYSVFGFDDHGVMGGSCQYDQKNKIISKYAFPYHTRYEEKVMVEDQPSYSFLFSNIDPSSCDMSKRRFFGSDDITDIPDAIVNGQCSGINAEAEDFCGVMAHELNLKPGQSTTFHLVLGSASNPQQIIDLKENLDNAAIENEWQATKSYWQNIYSNFKISTPDNDLNYQINHWLKKQVTLLCRQNRGTPYCPVRNQLQDAMGYAVIDPQGAISFMMDVLACQQKNGFIQQWHFTDGTPPKGLCMLHHTDGPLWLVICIVSLIHQNGDRGLLEKQVAYSDGEPGTIYEHLHKAIHFMADNLGIHGLCLIGDGDWNDPINGVGREGKGESTWSTMALIYSINEILALVGDTKVGLKEELKPLKEKLKKSINQHCWDGDRYVAGFDDDGVAYGSRADNDRLFLNTQTWSIVAGIIEPSNLNPLLTSMKRLDTPFGPLLLDPPFEEWDSRWGRVSLKKSGTTENGSIYCHASMFKAFADVVRQDGDALYDVIRRTLPTNPDNPPQQSLQLPVYIANYYYGLSDSANFGRSSMHYGTGTSAWMLIIVIEGLLGIKATVNGLMVNPCLPKSWNNASCTRVFRKSTYEFIFTRKGNNNIIVNNGLLKGNILPYEEGQNYLVEVNY